MITNSLGSHIAYCAALGHKVMLTSDFRNRSVDEFRNEAWAASCDAKFIEKFAYYHSLPYFTRIYGNLFTTDQFTNSLVSWGRNEVGVSRVLKPHQIIEVLGWSKRAYLDNAYRSLRFRLSILLNGKP